MFCKTRRFYHKAQQVSQNMPITTKRNITTATSKDFFEFFPKRKKRSHFKIIEIGTEFLAEHCNAGTNYSPVNSTRSVLSTINKPVDNIPFGKSELVCRFLNRIFHFTRVLPRYITTWSVTKVFDNYVRSKTT